MSEVVLKGLVLQSADYRETSRMLTVLTDRAGKLSVGANGARRKNSRIAPACQPFAFSEMVLRESRGRYYLNEVSVIDTFAGLANDLKTFALGSYFLDLLNTVCQEGEEAPDVLSLGLNALWLLCEGKKPTEIIKSAFELRLMSLLGYCPDLEGCSVCGKAEPDEPVLDLQGGTLYCKACSSCEVIKPYTISESVLKAMRYIIASKSEKVFSFTLSDRQTNRLSSASERYVTEQLERHFSTLDYYKQLK